MQISIMHLNFFPFFKCRECLFDLLLILSYIYLVFDKHKALGRIPEDNTATLFASKTLCLIHPWQT